MNKLIFIYLFLITSCSSVMNGKTQKITVTSNVKGAKVMVNGVPIGKTPVTATVAREKTFSILVSRKGYETYNATVATKLDPWFWGNIIIGGVYGSTTDLVLGTTHVIDPSNIYIELEKEEGK